MKTELDFLGKHINIASRSRRRWLVVLIYAGFAALVIAWFMLYGRSPFGLLSVLAFLAFGLLSRFLGGRTSRGGLLPPFESKENDERELRRRDHAYYTAYKWWDFALIPAFLATGLKYVPLSPSWSPVLGTFFDRLPWGLLIAAGILYYTLPQAILLWTETDMDPDA
jgi:hypothetical protein